MSTRTAAKVDAKREIIRRLELHVELDNETKIGTYTLFFARYFTNNVRAICAVYIIGEKPDAIKTTSAYYMF